ncbi:MAG: pseudouridine synthase [Chitinophagaceae bacterium]
MGLLQKGKGNESSCSTFKNCLPSLPNQAISKILYRYFVLHKPFRVLSQFSREGEKKTLADYFSLDRDVYPVGRLDYDSEGLLILTNDPLINHRLLNPLSAHEREYWVQVEGEITPEALDQLKTGIKINVSGKFYRTLPSRVFKWKIPPAVGERIPAIRDRKNIPTSWISVTLTEGKNRQVRKMTAATGFPTLRLVRYRIGGITLEGLASGQIQEWESTALMQSLFCTS